MRRALLLLVLTLAGPAAAYESKCNTPAPCEQGFQAARGRWIDAHDEHRQLWVKSAELAGLPAAAAEPFTLRAFTGSATVDVAGAQEPALWPVDFRDAKKVLDRPGPRTAGEFAQLPDFSYSLWDWARGNEDCPLGPGANGPIAPNVCHTFETHMGALNSNHFPPQSGEFFAHYHALAVARAKECSALSQKLGNARERFTDVLVACEQEALVLEAVGHHFLQDAWSMGHMWERWGSPDPPEFHADPWGELAVGIFSGLIHGARGSLEGLIGTEVNDAMCAPDFEVRWRRPNEPVPIPAIGDDYLGELFGGGYPEQYHALFSCTASAIRDVYEAFGTAALGPAEPMDPSLQRVDVAADCFRQRATNRALRAGAALDYKDGSVQHHITLDIDLIGKAIPAFVSGLAPDCASEPAECAKRVLRHRMDLMKVIGEIQLWSVMDPTGLQAASGALPAILDFAPNGRYAGKTPLSSFIDPPLPWPTSAADVPSTSLARVFHEAHAADWCREMSLDYLKGLQASTRTADDADEAEAAMEACTTFAARHVRGRSLEGVQVGEQPFCALASPSPQTVAYVDELVKDGITTSEDVAKSWCGCGDGVFDASLEECDASAIGGDEACPGRCRAPGNTTTLGATSNVFDDCNCGTCRSENRSPTGHLGTENFGPIPPACDAPIISTLTDPSMPHHYLLNPIAVTPVSSTGCIPPSNGQVAFEVTDVRRPGGINWGAPSKDWRDQDIAIDFTVTTTPVSFGSDGTAQWWAIDIGENSTGVIGGSGISLITHLSCTDATVNGFRLFLANGQTTAHCTVHYDDFFVASRPALWIRIIASARGFVPSSDIITWAMAGEAMYLATCDGEFPEP